jgi:pSer/pThr/pTyr-binding forkhead associated (FHA) protein/uncharacterized protein YoxC
MITTSLRTELTLFSAGSACDAWPSGRYHLRVQGPGLDEPLHALLEQPFLLVGRSRGAGLLLPDTRISRRHAYLHLSPEGVYVIHLSRRLGVADDGISPRGGWLGEAGGIDFGPYHVVLTPADCPAPRTAPMREQQNGFSGDPGGLPDLMSPRRCDGAVPTIEIHAPEGTGAVRHLKRPLTLIGRGKPSHLQLVHPSVSQPHCVLVHRGEDFWVVDLRSRLGTRLNDQPVEVARVDPSDQLQLGEVAMRIRRGHPTKRNGSSTRSAANAIGEMPHPLIGGAAKSIGTSDEEPLAVQAPPPEDDVLPAIQADGNQIAPVVEQGGEQPWDHLQRELDAAKARADELEARLAHQDASQGLFRERVERVATQLEVLEAQQQVTVTQTEEQTARMQALAERVEQLSLLCDATRDSTESVELGIRTLAERLSEVQRCLEDRWREQSEAFEQRIAELVRSHGAEAAASQRRAPAQHDHDDAAPADLQRQWLRQQQEWDRQRSALEQQHEELRGQVRALEQSHGGLQETGAEVRRECDQLREAWHQRATTSSEEKAWLEQQLDAVHRRQQEATAFADELRRQCDAQAQQWQEQHSALVTEQFRAQQQLLELEQQRTRAEEECAQLKELVEQQRQDQPREADDQQRARLQAAIDEQAAQLDEFGRRLAALQAVDRTSGDGQAVQAQIAACTDALREEFHDALRRVVGAGQQHGAPAAEPNEMQEAPATADALDPLLETGRATGVDERELVHSETDAATDFDVSDDQDGVDEAAGTGQEVTQWLFERAATLHDRRRRRWRRRVVLPLAVLFLLAIVTGAFVLLQSGALDEVGRLLFG